LHVTNVHQVTDCDSFVEYDNPQRIPCPQMATRDHTVDEIVDGKVGDFVTIESDVQAFARLVRHLARYLSKGPESTALLTLAARFDVTLDRRPTMGEFIRELEHAVEGL
jgi:hypothetical protein